MVDSRPADTCAEQQLPAGHRDALDQTGYVVLKDFISAKLLLELQRRVADQFQLEGASAGSEFKQEPGSRRLANLVNKGDIFQQVIADPTILRYVQHVIGTRIKLSSLNARSVDADSIRRQPLHCDMGAIADHRGYWVCNTVWMLDDITVENGAIRAVPGSHLHGALPQDLLEDPSAVHSEQVLITGTAGTVVVMNAHLWHGGMENRTRQPRTALHAFYCRHDKPQQQHQKKLLDPALQSRLSPRIRELLALDDARNDALCEQNQIRSGFLK